MQEKPKLYVDKNTPNVDKKGAKNSTRQPTKEGFGAHPEATAPKQQAAGRKKRRSRTLNTKKKNHHTRKKPPEKPQL